MSQAVAPVRRIVVLLGIPGAGKGTQAKEIVRRLNIPQISTGDMLREAMSRHEGLAMDARRQMNIGGLVSDSTVNSLVAERINQDDCGMGFILDGYPRTVSQAQTLQQHLKRSDRLFVIEIRVDDSHIVERLVGRLMCSNCGEIFNSVSRMPKTAGWCDDCGVELVRRSDDREDLILERFRIYREETFPLVEHYRQSGCYHRVDGLRPIAEVTQDIRKIVDCEER